jgi:hypothetical protein
MRRLTAAPAVAKDDVAYSRHETEGTMAEVAFAIPILPGQEQLDRQIFQELEGARRTEYEAALAEAGITRHAVWHQETPDGTLAIVYMQADDQVGVGKFAASDAPLNRWFREQMQRRQKRCQRSPKSVWWCPSRFGLVEPFAARQGAPWGTTADPPLCIWLS